MVHPFIIGGKVIAGKVGEQVAIQAAAELILRQFRPSPDGGSHTPEHMIQQLLSGIGSDTMKPKRKKKNPFNKIVSVELKKLKNKKGTQRNKFKLAISRAKRIHNAAKKKKSK